MNEPKEEVSKMILDYLHEHPYASDTLEGITRWWLNYQNLERSVDEVSTVLEELIKKGIIKRHLRPENGNPIYKIRKKS